MLACTDDPAVNAAVAAEADRRQVFCSRADEALGGSAWVPASGGPGLSRWRSTPTATRAVRLELRDRLVEVALAKTLRRAGRAGAVSSWSAAAPATPA